jgi:NADH:ubiquinone oxidoreductase subunit E
MALSARDKVGSVLIVGAGIGGMQASLDLANAGFKVYLVEKSPAIGGVMAQLDKTFPTNDCAMCTLAPRMVDCGNNRNIEKLTYSEVLDVEGEPGHFRVRVRKKARSVDPDKCTGCGECATQCLVRNRAYFEPPEPEPLDLAAEELTEVDRILDEYGGERGSILPILQDINAKYKWLPPGAVRRVSDVVRVPLAHVLRIATFYNALSLTPRGKYTISVCLGTACYVKGGQRILEAFERELSIEVGGTTEDLNFSLETVNCVGCCGQSPVVTVNEDIYGYMKQTRVPKILKEYA